MTRIADNELFSLLVRPRGLGDDGELTVQASVLKLVVQNCCARNLNPPPGHLGPLPCGGRGVQGVRSLVIDMNGSPVLLQKNSPNVARHLLNVHVKEENGRTIARGQPSSEDQRIVEHGRFLSTLRACIWRMVRLQKRFLRA